MIRGGSVSKAFRIRWAARTTAEAAAKALEAMIPTITKSGAPINVESVAKYVGIEQINEVETSSFDGMLSATSPHAYVVTLRKAQSEVRKRFTLAHEIGHAIVYRSIGRRASATEDGAVLKCRAETADEKDEERLCDLLAAQLLIPRDQLNLAIEEMGACAQSVPAIARLFRVSLEAASRRLVELLPYEIGIGRWSMQADSGHVVPQWYVTRRGARSVEDVIAVGSPGSQCFAEKNVRGWQWFPLHGQMDKYYVDVCPLVGPKKAWIMFVVFDSAAEHIMTTLSKRKSSSTLQFPLLDE
jgi:Zn-dependent peptidase ImmA (M78 family)